MNHREIDRLVAEKVMGWKIEKGELGHEHFTYEGEIKYLPYYSTRMEDAYKSVKKLAENYGVDIYTELGSPSIVKLWDDGEIIVEVISQKEC